MKELVVAAVQLASEPGAVQANTAKMLRWISRASDAGAGLVVFPECSLTGYSTRQADAIAIGADEKCALQLERGAFDRGVAVGYGFVERRNDALPYSTYVVAAPDGRLSYRKAHLGASELEAFSAGDEIRAARVAGVQMGVQLCWEGHIADVASTVRTQGAELLLAPHAIGIGGARRLELWSRYLPARALDNGMFVVACNALRNASRRAPEHADDGPEDQARTDFGSTEGGGLAAYAPDGSLIASYEGFDEHMVLVDVGGALPRDMPQHGMRNISYFDRRRPELYERP